MSRTLRRALIGPPLMALTLIALVFLVVIVFFAVFAAAIFQAIDKHVG